MARSKRLAILEVIVERLEAITVANGYETDAGANIHLGAVPILGPDDPPIAIAVLPQGARPTAQHRKIALHWVIVVQAVAKADLEEPWIAVELVLGDIKRAIEVGDPTMGGLVSQSFERGEDLPPAPRESGQTTTGVGVVYLIPYVEPRGHPEWPVTEAP